MLKTRQRSPNQWRTPCTISLNYFSYGSEEGVFHRDWLSSKYLNPQRKWALLELNGNQGIFLRLKMFSLPDWCVSLVAFLLPFYFIRGKFTLFPGIWRFILHFSNLFISVFYLCQHLGKGKGGSKNSCPLLSICYLCYTFCGAGIMECSPSGLMRNHCPWNSKDFCGCLWTGYSVNVHKNWVLTIADVLSLKSSSVEL